MQPVVNRLEADYSDEIDVRSFDARNDGEKFFDQLTLRGHPALVLFDADANETYRALGIQPEANLRDAIDAALSGAERTPETDSG